MAKGKNVKELGNEISSKQEEMVKLAEDLANHKSFITAGAVTLVEEQYGPIQQPSPGFLSCNYGNVSGSGLLTSALRSEHERFVVKPGTRIQRLKGDNVGRTMQQGLLQRGGNQADVATEARIDYLNTHCKLPNDERIIDQSVAEVVTLEGLDVIIDPDLTAIRDDTPSHKFARVSAETRAPYEGAFQNINQFEFRTAAVKYMTSMIPRTDVTDTERLTAVGTKDEE